MGNDGDVIGRSRCEARPSLAITKYWGKRDVLRNTPATPSLGVTLGGLSTVTEVEIVSGGGAAWALKGPPPGGRLGGAREAAGALRGAPPGGAAVAAGMLRGVPPGGGIR